MICEIIRISKGIDENVDFKNLVFRIMAENLLDFDKSNDFWISLKTLIKGGLLKVIVDMKGLQFIDSIGIGVLINTAKLIRSKGGEIVILNVPPHIEKILKPVNLERFIKFFSSFEDIKKFFRFT